MLTKHWLEISTQVLYHYCQKIYCGMRIPETILEIRKKNHISLCNFFSTKYMFTFVPTNKKIQKNKKLEKKANRFTHWDKTSLPALLIWGKHRNQIKVSIYFFSLYHINLSYLLPLYKSSFVKYFSSSIKIHISILMSLIMSHLQRLVKFWHYRKKWDVDSASKLQEWGSFIVFRKLFKFMFSIMT